MKLILSYELPFILAVLVPVIKAGYSIRLGDLLVPSAKRRGGREPVRRAGAGGGAPLRAGQARARAL